MYSRSCCLATWDITREPVLYMNECVHVSIFACRMVAAERDKIQDEVRLTKMQHEDDLCAPTDTDAPWLCENSLSYAPVRVCEWQKVVLPCSSRKAAEVRREAAALLDKARREQDAAAASKTTATAAQAAADEAASQQRREAAVLDSTRVRFEAECAERIQQLDAREDAVRRSEGMSQRLQEQERALQVAPPLPGEYTLLYTDSTLGK